jgi:hypothetical protein
LGAGMSNSKMRDKKAGRDAAHSQAEHRPRQG